MDKELLQKVWAAAYAAAFSRFVFEEITNWSSQGKPEDMDPNYEATKRAIDVANLAVEDLDYLGHLLHPKVKPE